MQKVFVVFLLSFLLNFSGGSPLIAAWDSPSEPEQVNFASSDKWLESDSSVEGLDEVPPPPAVQQIRLRLAHYNPKLSIESPANGKVLMKGINEKWQIVLNVEDWPLVEDPELGLGPHLVVQIDDLDPLRIVKSEGKSIVIPMDGLSPGSHRLAAYLAYPWGEALKEPGTAIESRIHFFKELPETQPEIGTPWLTVSSPSDMSFIEPLLIDSLIWNAPIQGLKEGDDQWRLRVSVNGESFLMNSQEPVWIKGLPSDQINVQFELLDTAGKQINPIFTNKIKVLSTPQLDQPFWMSSSFSEQQIARLIGETEIPAKTAFLTEQSPPLYLRQDVSSSEVKDDPAIAKYELIFPRETPQ